ncbi:ABC transporter ATP-binding protein [Sporomusa acidovorans]|uniref:Iron(3+)-hydroxamate import ATP-binding protein FhuC n=1 Tax=Sporomusa acidovorans (strain ATCC 49682 / DSM 3132 / Mol) TaxID=1123286 RepID=A0ABZ3IXU6_SPOA4|nr:ABC transporter ATP-binding protein [Sporomusa acidovorans]OZC22171.1 iron(3+)-hydroxamate import ATP-binding protein FhuC [Sporomusa acidovorans DSM 3132]SDE82221.1 iron complex transport system ATP-binding protein [Sporomusa acidovorans]
MILVVDGVEFSYNGRPVLKTVSFTVARGEVVSILGNNGAGKSTLLKCMNRILNPHKGAVLIESDALSRLSRLEIARRVGYVAQKYESSRFTVMDAVLLGRKPHIKWEAKLRDMEIVQRALKNLGLTEYAMRYLDELSGGELQKVVIARALAQEPRVLLLDEPTSNLDLKNQLEVLSTVRKTAHEQNIAVLVVLHDLNLALRFSDKFLLLQDGTTFACGGVEVMSPENIASVYGVPVAVEKLGGVPVVIPFPG